MAVGQNRICPTCGGWCPPHCVNQGCPWIQCGRCSKVGTPERWVDMAPLPEIPKDLNDLPMTTDDRPTEDTGEL